MKFHVLRLGCLALSLCLSACGFELRGYQPADPSQTRHALAWQATPVQLAFGNSLEDVTLKNALKKQFSLLAVPSQDASLTNTNEAKPVSQLPRIEVQNIHLQSYQLRGILTEIRLVMSVDVRYIIHQQGQPMTINNTIQVQRSYQYNQATLATDDPQAEQIKVWLYNTLAQRIADQYLALAMPTLTMPNPEKPS